MNYKTSFFARLLLLFLLIFPSSLYGFTPELYRAIQTFEQGNSGARDMALFFRDNDLINQMRIKHVISHETYQHLQTDYSNKSEELATKSAIANNANLQVQQRVAGNPYDAGTDSDYILNAKTADQIKKIKAAYNNNVNEYLGEFDLPIEGDGDWSKRHDVDFMADPAGMSKKEFKKVAPLNNDTYISEKSARFEEKIRSIDTLPSVDEALDYHDEMRNFTKKKTQQIKAKSQELNNLMKSGRDTRSPQQGGTDANAYERRMSLEAQIQIKQAHKAKYFERSQIANDVLASHAGTNAPDSSDLPSKAKIRSAPGETAHQRQVSSALADSATTYLDNQSKTNEIRLLGVLAGRDPARSQEYKQRMANLADSLPTSQKGEVIELLRQNPNVDDALIKDVVSEIKAAPVKTSKLAKAGAVAGFAGDILSINTAWNAMETGDHLLIDINENDSDTIKGIKYLGVAALELYPVPIIDAMERGWKVDEKVKQEIKEDIKKGVAVNPFWYTFRMIAEISSDVGASFIHQPLMSGVEAVKEGTQTTKNLWQNWKDEEVRDSSLLLQEKKFNDILARIDAVKLGPVIGKRINTQGVTFYNLNQSLPGDTFSFSIQPNSIWTDQYLARWDLTNAHKQPVAWKGTKTGYIPATENQAKSVIVDEQLPPGKYIITFRIFDKKTGKQMDASNKTFTIIDYLAMGQLVAKKENHKGAPFSRNAVIGDQIALSVERLGKWDQEHEIEWLINGTTYKKKSADNPDCHGYKVKFSDIYNPGFYEIAVRAINKKTGKIIAHQKTRLLLKATNILLPVIALSQGTDFDRGTPVKSGQTLSSKEGKLWAVSTIWFPVSDRPIATTISWELLNDSGTSLGVKSVVYDSDGGQKELFTKFSIGKLNNGRYTIVLKKISANDPQSEVKTRVVFVINEFIKLKQQWVTTKPGNTENKSRLTPSDIPHLYLSFDMNKDLDSVQTLFSVVNKKSGDTIFKWPNEYKFSPEKIVQRTGVRIPAGLVKPGDEVVFIASISPSESEPDLFKPVTKFIEFSVILQTLKIRASRTLMGDQAGHYSITVPEGFVGPYTVRIGGDGLQIRKSSNPLRGKLHGAASTSDRRHTFTALVKDANGLTARGKAVVMVRGLDPKTMASKKRPKQILSYTPPPKPTPAKPPVQTQSSSNGWDNVAKETKAIMDTYTKEMQRIQQKKNARTSGYKGSVSKPNTPKSSIEVSGKNNCRTFRLNLSDCKSSYYQCKKQCDDQYNASTQAKALRQCYYERCGKADEACRQSKCPGGSRSGVGWDAVECTICQ